MLTLQEAQTAQSQPGFNLASAAQAATLPAATQTTPSSAQPTTTTTSQPPQPTTTSTQQPGVSQISNPTPTQAAPPVNTPNPNAPAIIGTTASKVNPNVTEYYNTQTGQGFASPQDLSTFVNQNGGQTTPQNVFGYLQNPTNFSNLNAAFQKAKGPVPQTQGEASSAIQGLMGDSKSATANNNALNFLNTNSAIQDAIKQVQSYLQPTVTTATLQSYIDKIQTDQNTLSGLNTSLMNIQKIMNGTSDNIRQEVQAANGFATESQVMALSTARNKTLIQQANLIQNQITTATDAIKNDQNLLDQERSIASEQFSQNATIYNAAQGIVDKIQAAQKDGINTLIQSVGLNGLVKGTMLADPSGNSLNQIAKILGMTPEELKGAATQEQNTKNLSTIHATGINSGYVNVNGEIQNATTGEAYSSPEDFQKKTGMTLQQAQAQGLIKNLPQSLDTQSKLTDIAYKQAQSYKALHPSSSGSGGGLTTGVSGNTTVAGVQVPAAIANDVQDVLTGRNTLYNIRQTMGRTNAAAKYMADMRAAIKSIDPSFDFVASDAGGKFVSSEYYQRSAAAINSVLPNIKQVVDLSNQVSRFGIASVDSMLQKGQVQIGNQKVANFREAQKLISDEIGLALGQGSVSDMKLQLGYDVTDPSVSPEVFASNMGIVEDFIKNRLAGLKEQRYSSSVPGLQSFGSSSNLNNNDPMGLGF